jgi:hypothetical protein
VVGALGGWEEVEEVADGVPEPIDGALGGLAQQGLELGEGLLDRIEITLRAGAAAYPKAGITERASGSPLSSCRFCLS